MVEYTSCSWWFSRDLVQHDISPKEVVRASDQTITLVTVLIVGLLSCLAPKMQGRLFVQKVFF